MQGGFVETVAAEWRSLADSERAYWEGMAKKDKTRHSKETKSFKGPIGRKLRTKKNPLAPKRPMSGERLHLEFPLLSLWALLHSNLLFEHFSPLSRLQAFLMYAQVKRKLLQKENPDMSNADISRLLGEVWRNTGVPEKRPFLEREEAERKIYKARMAAWKNNEKLANTLAKSPKSKQLSSFPRDEFSSEAHGKFVLGNRSLLLMII